MTLGNQNCNLGIMKTPLKAGKAAGQRADFMKGPSKRTLEDRGSASRQVARVCPTLWVTSMLTRQAQV